MRGASGSALAASASRSSTSRPTREHAETRVQKRTATAVEEIGVVEVDVDEAWERPPRERASEVTERVRRRDRARARGPTGARRVRARAATPSARPPRGTAAGTPSECSRRSRAPRTPRRPRRPSTSRRRRTASARGRLPQASSFVAAPGRRCAAGRTCVVGRGPVRVMSERPASGSLARALEPGRLVLSVRRVGAAA